MTAKMIRLEQSPYFSIYNLFCDDADFCILKIKVVNNNNRTVTIISFTHKIS